METSEHYTAVIWQCQLRHVKTLIERLAWPSTLQKAYHEVVTGANPKSFGPDRISIEDFRQSYRSQIAALRNDIKSGNYHPSLGRGVPILKKRDGGLNRDNVRPITVFNIRDRIVQRAIANLIWPALRTKVFSEVSFGGIRSYKTRGDRNKSCADVVKNVESAARRILRLRSQGLVYTFETDIQRFFPSIDRGRLLQSLREVLPDDSLLELIDKSINTEVANASDIEARGLSECWDAELGVPQGAVLSPLLANLYLAEFDEAINASGFSLVRYVDDLVIPTSSKAEAERAFHECKETLAKLGLSIHELNQKNEKGKIKTRVLGEYQSFEFLGLRFNKNSIHPAPNKLSDLKEKIRAATNARIPHTTLVDVVNRLNRLLRGWMRAYRFCDFPPTMQKEIDHLAGSGLAAWMEYHKLIPNAKRIDHNCRSLIGLWPSQSAEFRPISKAARLDASAKELDADRR